MTYPILWSGLDTWILSGSLLLFLLPFGVGGYSLFFVFLIDSESYGYNFS
ncbi:hypothetical protein [Vibrio phage vB_pir03]|nr:hypothetical protein [Vibrio phage vB_pir03]